MEEQSKLHALLPKMNHTNCCRAHDARPEEIKDKGL